MLLPRFNFQEFNRLQREMNRMFERKAPRIWQHTAPSFPAMNVWTNEEGMVVTAELPGFNLDDIDISIEGDKLTLSGSRKPAAVAEGTQYHRRERGYGQFSRTFQLPFAVEADRVNATYNAGVLSISLPKAEADKPHKIAIHAA